MNQTIEISVWRIIAGILGMTSVMLGAVAAHAVSDVYAAASVERAALYQLIHAGILLLSTFLTGRWVSIARLAIFSGICLFSGSIYAKYLLGFAQATKLAPSGGVMLMSGWLFLTIAACVAMSSKSGKA